eukprot:6186932-Pleurochrysis_carterae.AAC.1
MPLALVPLLDAASNPDLFYAEALAQAVLPRPLIHEAAHETTALGAVVVADKSPRSVAAGIQTTATERIDAIAAEAAALLIGRWRPPHAHSRTASSNPRTCAFAARTPIAICTLPWCRRPGRVTADILAISKLRPCSCRAMLLTHCSERVRVP